LLSAVAVAVYGFDKRRACNGGRRVPERSLHLIALLGGWPGALAGQRMFRHKTQKTAFRIVLWLTIAVHLVVVVGAVYLLSKTAVTTPL
jgi:uncharacterized membrane protein YsdA (DUF1294 family)